MSPYLHSTGGVVFLELDNPTCLQLLQPNFSIFLKNSFRPSNKLDFLAAKLNSDEENCSIIMINMDSTDSYFLEILENTAKFDHDLFNIFENLENDPVELIPPLTPLDDQVLKPLPKSVSQKCINSSTQHDFEAELEATSSHDTPRSHKRAKITVTPSLDQEASQDGQQRIMHITVERNRRKQMNENLSMLRTLMPCFYVKRGDQASIIGGVVDYIKELEQVLQSLEAKKQRKYSEVLSPIIVSSPRPSTALSSPRKPPLSPRVNVPISPRTPQPSSPYKPKPQQQLCVANYNISPSTSTTTTALLLEPASSSSSSFDHNNVNKELVENSKSSVADVEVKFSGPNVLLKTVSRRITGQVLKIITAIEALSLEILHLSINIVDETMVNSFTIKIGIECQLSVEDLAHEIQQTFS